MKPRISKQPGYRGAFAWACSGLGLLAFGRTFTEAYEKWAAGLSAGLTD
jgi:hypothetical protein